MNNKLSLENKIKNSNCQITKNILYYLIAPVVILLIGAILLCTVGFNNTTDFAGGSSFTVYINNGGEFGAEYQYELDEDYNVLCDKIAQVLGEEGCQVESFQQTQIDIKGIVAGGDAIKVVFKNSSENIDAQNVAIGNRVLAALYGSSQNADAITDVDHFAAKISLGWSIALVGAVIFAITAASVYLALRSRSPIWLMAVLIGGLDIMLTAGLLLICRIPVGVGVAAAFALCGVLSIINTFCFFTKAKHDIANGLYERFTNARMADATAKQLAYKKAIIYIILALIAIMGIIIPVNGIRYVFLAIFLMLISTFYTANFVTPAIWAAVYKVGKKKR